MNPVLFDAPWAEAPAAPRALALLRERIRSLPQVHSALGPEPTAFFNDDTVLVVSHPIDVDISWFWPVEPFGRAAFARADNLPDGFFAVGANPKLPNRSLIVVAQRGGRRLWHAFPFERFRDLQACDTAFGSVWERWTAGDDFAPDGDELTISGNDCTDLRALAGWGHLRQLCIINCEQMRSMDGIEGAEGLEILRIDTCPALLDVGGLANLPLLTELVIALSPQLANVAPLSSLPLLRELVLDAVAVQALPDLRGCRRLQKVRVMGASQLCDVSGVGGHPSLEELWLPGAHADLDLAGIASLPRLRELNLRGRPISDFALLARHPRLEHVVATTANSADLAPLAGLRHLRELELELPSTICDVSPLGAIPELAVLRMRRRDVDTDDVPRVRFGPATWPKLRELELDAAVDDQPEDLTAWAHLVSAKLTQVADWQDLSHLRHAKRLMRLELPGATDLRRLDGLGGSLQQLTLRWCGQLEDVAALAQTPALRQLIVEGAGKLMDYGVIDRLPQLRHLVLDGGRLPPAPAWLAYLPQLTRMRLRGIEGLDSLVSLRAPRLTMLELESCADLRDLSGLERATSLEYLTVRDCLRVEALPTLGHLADLKWLRLRGLPFIERLDALRGALSLTFVQATALAHLTRVGALAHCPALRRLRLQHCPYVRDLGQLVGHAALFDVVADDEPAAAAINIRGHVRDGHLQTIEGSMLAWLDLVPLARDVEPLADALRAAISLGNGAHWARSALTQLVQKLAARESRA